MRWLADECVHAPVVVALRSEGHDVVYAAETAGQTVDRNLAEEAHRTGRILLTEDRDFGELVFRKKQPTYGVVLLRFPSERRSMKWLGLKAAIDDHGEALHRSITVVEEARARRRPLVADDKAN